MQCRQVTVYRDLLPESGDSSSGEAKTFFTFVQIARIKSIYAFNAH